MVHAVGLAAYQQVVTPWGPEVALHALGVNELNPTTARYTYTGGLRHSTVPSVKAVVRALITLKSQQPR